MAREVVSAALMGIAWAGTGPRVRESRPRQHPPRAGPLGTWASGVPERCCPLQTKPPGRGAPPQVGQTRERVSFASSDAPLPLRPSPCPSPGPPGPSLHVTAEQGGLNRAPHSATSRAGPRGALQGPRRHTAGAGLGRRLLRAVPSGPQGVTTQAQGTDHRCRPRAAATRAPGTRQAPEASGESRAQGPAFQNGDSATPG